MNERPETHSRTRGLDSRRTLDDVVVFSYIPRTGQRIAASRRLVVDMAIRSNKPYLATRLFLADSVCFFRSPWGR